MEWAFPGPTPPATSFPFQIANLMDGSPDFPADTHRWQVTLQRDTTYRIEWRLDRTATEIFTLQARIYNSANQLLFGNADFVCQRFGHNGHTIATAGNAVRILENLVPCLGSLFIVHQGLWTAVPETGDKIYYGGCAVSRTDWCGEYTPGEST